MRWLCLFVMCKWIHIVNINDKVGLYQCRRCKKISKGQALISEKREMSGKPLRRIKLLIEQVSEHLISNNLKEGSRWDVSIDQRDEWLLELVDLVEEELKEDRPFKC